MGCCYSGYGKFVIWILNLSCMSKKRKCEIDRPYRLTGVNPSRKQKGFSPSFLSQAQGDTSDRVNLRSLGY